uniref:Leucine rich repeat protein n=1 Tax=Pithovirus LCPAC001 TaxID=2506585 RepID=A0A481Z4N2_9VIRU|nr:MAG: leucine rich repeat protein [Pithovirus LCPAC001]
MNDIDEEDIIWLVDTNQILDMNRFGLTEWPKWLMGKEHLIVKLDCSENKLVNLPKGLTNLRHLLCFSNNLVVLPGDMSSLEYLNCSYNHLTSIPEGLTMLETLYCGSNQLTSLPKTSTNKLKKLHCENNCIMSKTSTNKLKKLHLKLEYEMPHLTSLDCSNNNIHTLPYLPKLDDLCMFSGYSQPLSGEIQDEIYLSLYQEMFQKDIRIKELEDVVTHLRYRPGGPGYKTTLSHFNDLSK